MTCGPCVFAREERVPYSYSWLVLWQGTASEGSQPGIHACVFLLQVFVSWNRDHLRLPSHSPNHQPGRTSGYLGRKRVGALSGRQQAWYSPCHQEDHPMRMQSLCRQPIVYCGASITSGETLSTHVDAQLLRSMYCFRKVPCFSWIPRGAEQTNVNMNRLCACRSCTYPNVTVFETPTRGLVVVRSVVHRVK